MMSFSYFSFHYFLTLLLISPIWFSFSQPLCHDDERSSLLQFKQSFTFNKRASYNPIAYPKAASWTAEGATDDCCQWDGVECDKDSGHVVSLDLSSSFLYGSIDSNSSLFSLVHLQMLNLADNYFNYSQIPSSIKQLSKLTYLDLSFAAFSGQIPSEISELRNLSVLDLSFKPYISSKQSLLKLKRPDLKSLIQNMTKLEVLSLSFVNISSAFPSFLANFSSLTSLNLSGCGLRGDFPAEIFQLRNLQYLTLRFNDLTGELPPFNKSSALKLLDVAENGLSGSIPFSIGKLGQLEFLSLSENKFWGSIPSSLGNLTQLAYLELFTNHLSGPIPSSFSKLKNLEILVLANNELSGTVNFDMFLTLKNLTQLVLSQNNLSLLIKPGLNETPPQYTVLQMGFCTLSSFPDFLRNQTRMGILELRVTSIGGLIPQWLMNISRATLFYLDLVGNSFTGEVSHEICNFKFLSVLLLGNNTLFGKLPSCLGNFTNSLELLYLGGNSFSGNIPEFAEGSQLKIIDFTDNQLQGKIPQSLKNCKVLEHLGLGSNQLNDVFPYWLGAIPTLRVLLLWLNRFHGVIEEPQTGNDFPQLRIIDISENSFTGKLPSKYIQNWKAMKRRSNGPLSYMMTNVYHQFQPGSGAKLLFGIPLEATITIKGVKRHYDRINADLAVIDFSNNYFDGEIPEVLGSLKGLHAIDLSSNNLSGGIPSSLGNLSELESLDLSQNMLSGEIPQELMKLTFLEYFNVSRNRLTGPIPQANQLSRFDATSYVGNLGLCGIPLPDKCGSSEAPHSSNALEDELPDDSFGFGWKVVAIGYACGFLAGMFIGKVVIARRPRSFAMIYRVNMHAKRKRSVRRVN